MEKFEITNVGLLMDTLETNAGIVYGTATVYSKDLDSELNIEYVDDFDFTYDIEDDFATIDLDETVFGEHFATIESILIDNLKTNYLRNGE